uniref:Putative secreted protein n=1 Tax=Anopheles darlingi TaxID=43151 RepID=A0A2M4D5C3_ANODA
MLLLFISPPLPDIVPLLLLLFWLPLLPLLQEAMIEGSFDSRVPWTPPPTGWPPTARPVRLVVPRAVRRVRRRV